MAVENKCEPAATGDLRTLERVLSVLYGKPRREQACALLRRFGSVKDVLGATKRELIGAGLTERAAAFLSFALPCYRRAALSALSERRIVSGFDLVIYCVTFFLGERESCEYVVCTDRRGGAVCAKRVRGIRDIVAVMCEHGPGKIAWATYSPTGAEADVARRRQIKKVRSAAKALGLEFMGYVGCTARGCELI